MIDYDTPLDSLDFDYPAWIDAESMETLADLHAVAQGGCASGAYMPAVVYHQAMETMAEHGDDVLQYVQDNYGELPRPDDNTSWSGLAVHYLSCAVDLWVRDAAQHIADHPPEDATSEDIGRLNELLSEII